MVREHDESHPVSDDAGRPSRPRYELPSQVHGGTAYGPASAEELLGWLGAHGCTRVEVSATGGGVGVRCVCPPGFWLGDGGAVRLWVG